jgi:thiol-disulfide isomerase/thioredoxin
VVASSVDAEKEESILRGQDVNSSSFTSFHSGQMFADGLSFSGFERNKVFIGRGDGSFADLSNLSGADTPRDSRGAVWADFDDDGDADIFVHNLQRERHDLYRNDIHTPGSDEAGFLKVRLRATALQYEAIGATVTVSGPWGKTSQVLSRGAGFNSCQVPELIFGLGANKVGQVEVLWPGGHVDDFGELESGTRALLEEGGEWTAFESLPRTLPDPKPPGLMVESGDLIKKLILADENGERYVLDLEQLTADGTPVFLNLWASYCPGCVAELPLLKQRAASGEMRVVTVSMDPESSKPAAKALLARFGDPFTQLYLPERAFDEEAGPDELLPEQLFDLERLAIPSTIVVGKGGRIEAVIRGQLRE